MNTIDRNQLIDQILTQRRSFQGGASARQLPVPIDQTTRPVVETHLSVRPPETVMQGLAAAQPRLISENVDTMERGFRRTQIFRQSDGRNFIRNEEVTLTERGMQRTVLQENPSGSKTRFEETLEKQSDGTFRRTVRHIDETGALATKIEDGTNGMGRFLLGGELAISHSSSADNKTRGVYFDRTI